MHIFVVAVNPLDPCSSGRGSGWGGGGFKWGGDGGGKGRGNRGWGVDEGGGVVKGFILSFHSLAYR